MFVVIVGVIEALFVGLSLAGSARAWIFGSDPNAYYILIMANLALIAVLLPLKATMEGSAVRDSIRGIERDLNTRSTVAALLDTDFYSRFPVALRAAQIGVAITHLDTRPPTRIKGSSNERYYGDLPKIVKSSRARFRRVDRASREKRSWLEGIVQQCSGSSNFSLGVLLTGSTDRKLPHVSVQLIDDDTTVLVAISEHDRTHGPRDIWIRDPDCTNLWRAYYDAILWRPAVKVIEDGVFNKDAWEEVVTWIEAL
jgi:hypothetical protein